MIEVALIIMLALGLAWPLGHYMAGVFSGNPHISDRVFGPVEGVIYKLIGVNPNLGMTWKNYVWALLFCNLMLGIVAYLILLFQHVLPMNPDNIGSLSWDLALHTAVSFLTNTNQQHYSGQAQLSYLSQGFLIVTLQVVTPVTGLAACVAILRGMFGGRNKDTAKEGEPRDLGNFYVDLVRGVLRVALPAALVMSLLLTWRGVPGLAQNSNPGFHGISQVFYEYTSAFANNGSGFEGLGDDTPWWNVTCVLALLLGRYLPMVLPLMVAGWWVSKRVAPAPYDLKASPSVLP